MKAALTLCLVACVSCWKEDTLFFFDPGPPVMVDPGTDELIERLEQCDPFPLTAPRSTKCVRLIRIYSPREGEIRIFGRAVVGSENEIWNLMWETTDNFELIDKYASIAEIDGTDFIVWCRSEWN